MSLNLRDGHAEAFGDPFIREVVPAMGKKCLSRPVRKRSQGPFVALAQPGLDVAEAGVFNQNPAPHPCPLRSGSDNPLIGVDPQKRRMRPAIPRFVYRRMRGLPQRLQGAANLSASYAGLVRQRDRDARNAAGAAAARHQ